MSFDPYHRWLGIAPDEQPAHHYRLLGIKLFEDQPDVIEAAADRQMAHLGNYKSGEHAELARKLLSEVAFARLCLLDPAKKAAYDADLRERMETAEAQAGPQAAPAMPFERTALATAASRQSARRARQTQLWASAAIVAVGVAAVVAILIRAGGPSSPPEQPSGPTAGVEPEAPMPSKPPLPAAPRERPPQPPAPVATETPFPLPLGSPPPAVAPFDAQEAREHQQRWARHLKAPRVGANSIGMALVLVPPGEFLMGSTPQQVVRLLDEGRREKDYEWYLDSLPSESPQHRVRITRPFYLGLCEVTQAEYQRVMGDNPSRFQGDPDRPVDKASWDDAAEFCRRLSELSEEKASGAVYRLPTEAEWEYACRAGTPTRFSFGDDAAQLGQHAWWNANSQGSTQRGCRLKPNAWNLFDMGGNLWEWCADWHGADYYAKSPVDDPAGPDSGKVRAVRGGAWNNAHRGNFRCALRSGRGPDAHFDSSGFRVAMSVSPGAKGLRPVQSAEETAVYVP